MINKVETTSDEDDSSDYDDNKGGDGRRSSAGRGGSAGVGYMRRAALVIGFGDSDLSARITSNRSEGVELESVLNLDFSKGGNW